PGAGGRDDLSPPAAVSGRERPCRATHRRDHPCAPTSLVYGGALNNRERRSVLGDQDQGHTQPSDHSPEYDENATGPCKKMPAPAPPSGARARLAPRPAAPRGQKSAGEVPKSEPPATPRLGNSRSVRDPGGRVQPGPCAKHRPSWATRSTQLRQDGGGIPVASPAPALGGP